YAPNAGYSGIDTFTYSAKDSSGQVTNTATVTLTVNPVATGDAYTVNAGATLSTTAGTGVLANDVGTGLSENAIVAGPTNGSLTLAANGSFTYTPNAGFSGTDTFTYNDKDSSGLTSNTVTVTLTVKPVAANDAYTTTTGSAITTTAGTGILANDKGASLVENAIVSAPSSGSLALNAD